MNHEEHRPSKNHLKRIHSLRTKKGRKEHGTFIVEGPKIINEAHQAGLEFRGLFFAESFSESERAVHFKVFVHENEVFVLRDSDFGKVSPTDSPQGIFAEIVTPGTPQIDSIDCSSPLIIILEEIQDPGNVGTAIRSCAALGGDAVYLTEGCADILNPKTVRATAGAMFHLPVVTDLTAEAILNRRQIIGASLIIAAADGESLHQIERPTSPTMIVFGNESRGPSSLWEEDPASRKVGLPMDRHIESLNVGVTVATFLAVLREKKNQNPVR